jgi:uncharacterized OB-fold protein
MQTIEIDIDTSRELIVDLTIELERFCAEKGEGLVNVFVPHATASLALSCTQCGTMHLPPQRVCATCGLLDTMTPEPAHDAMGTIVTVTADHLVYSLVPPMVAAVVDLDNGGRIQCEMTDLGLHTPTIGDRVEMTFRRAYTVDGVHNYVWKARLVASHLSATDG